MVKTPTVFGAPQADKEAALLPVLSDLVLHHRNRCESYDRILRAIGLHPDSSFESMGALPWLPVALFKHHVLRSVDEAEVVKTLTSSGTTGQEVSRIYLDRDAASQQPVMLSRTLREVLGDKRLPMLLVDTAALRSRREFSARTAGVLGMAIFGRSHTYVLDEDGRPDVEAVKQFLTRHGGEPFLIFGFTYMVWLYLFEMAASIGLDLSNGILVHSGGWKKMQDRGVSNDVFRRSFAQSTGLHRIHNYYGMVEQIGTVFLEGPSGGSFYCPDFADVIIRDPETWDEQPVGRPGLIEVLSSLPRSYPGHVLLTEDLGVLDGIDDGDWPGKRFSVLGRLSGVEARGCSDTFKESAA